MLPPVNNNTQEKLISPHNTYELDNCWQRTFKSKDKLSALCIRWDNSILNWYDQNGKMMVDPSVDDDREVWCYDPNLHTAWITVQSNTTSRQCIVTTVTQNPKLRTVARFNKPLTRL